MPNDYEVISVSPNGVETVLGCLSETTAADIAAEYNTDPATNLEFFYDTRQENNDD